METKPIEVFVSFSHKDEEYRRSLQTHLSLLERRSAIRTWHDGKIQPGRDWRSDIFSQLAAADIVLLLVSPDFIASDFCWGDEMEEAMKRHRSDLARVIPIILRPVDDWQSTPFGQLQALPPGGKPVTQWNDRDDAFSKTSAGIRKTVDQLLVKRQGFVAAKSELSQTARNPAPLQPDTEAKDVSASKQARLATSHISENTLLAQLSRSANLLLDRPKEHLSLEHNNSEFFVGATPLGRDPSRLKRDQQILQISREYEIEALFQKSLRHRLTVLTGGSGAGKSSLIYAGLVPKATELDILPVVIDEGYEAPLARLQHCLSQALRPIGETPSLHALLSSATADNGGQCKILLILDQFEQVFIQSEDSELADFLEALRELLDSTLELSIVVSIRSEWFTHLKVLEDVHIALAGALVLDSLSQDEAIKVIKTSLAPDSKTSSKFAPSLRRAILEDLSVNGFVTPIELQTVCRTLEVLEKTTASDYVELGKKDGVLALHFRQTVANRGDASKQLVYRVFLALGAERSGRRALSLEELRDITFYTPLSELKALLKRLEQQGIVRSSAGLKYEFTHDYISAKFRELAELELPSGTVANTDYLFKSVAKREAQNIRRKNIQTIQAAWHRNSYRTLILCILAVPIIAQFVRLLSLLIGLDESWLGQVGRAEQGPVLKSDYLPAMVGAHGALAFGYYACTGPLRYLEGIQPRHEKWYPIGLAIALSVLTLIGVIFHEIWMVLIGTGGVLVSSNLNSISSNYSASPQIQERFGITILYSFLNSTGLIAVGAILAYLISNQAGDSVLLIFWIVALVICMGFPRIFKEDGRGKSSADWRGMRCLGEVVRVERAIGMEEVDALSHQQRH